MREQSWGEKVGGLPRSRCWRRAGGCIGGVGVGRTMPFVYERLCLRYCGEELKLVCCGR